ncbi:MAG: hypothetical protein ACYC35_20200 [Pirellulales bacterium]
MNIPKFWSNATAEGVTTKGKAVAFSCWRSSDASEADAQESALAAAKRILDALLSGRQLDRYAYGCVPLREEVTNEVLDGEGNRIAVVTRNLYGSLVLNAERVMFVDIDFPPVTTGEATRHFFARLFGRARQTPETNREEVATAAVEQFVAANPGWGLRLYRTLAGLRGIVTHDVFDPKSSSALDVLTRMGSDPLYIRLCKAQECFRARLTPKPWRCGHHAASVRYPIADDAAAERQEQWQAVYDARQRGYATCRFLAHLGDGEVHPEVARIVELHDFVTRCNEALALA